MRQCTDLFLSCHRAQCSEEKRLFIEKLKLRSGDEVKPRTQHKLYTFLNPQTFKILSQMTIHIEKNLTGEETPMLSLAKLLR